jgi:HAMP domain-containing protein
MKLNIARKLWGTVAIALAALLVVGTFSLNGVNRMGSLGSALYTEAFKDYSVSSELTVLFEQQSSIVNGAPALVDLEAAKAAENELNELGGRMAEIATARLQELTAPDARERFEKVGPSLTAYLDASRKVFEFVKAFAQEDAINTSNGPVGEANYAFRTILDEIAQASRANAETQFNGMTSERETVTLTVIGAAVLAILIVAAIGFLVIGATTRSIRGLTGTMETLAQGNTDVEVQGTQRHDELGTMARTVEIFRDSMVETARLQQEQQEAERRKFEEEK